MEFYRKIPFATVRDHRTAENTRRLRFIILYPARKYIPGVSIFAWRHRDEQPRSPEIPLREKWQHETIPLTFFSGNIAGIIRRAFARALNLWK